jgi:hypothetical protein
VPTENDFEIRPAVAGHAHAWNSESEKRDLEKPKANNKNEDWVEKADKRFSHPCTIICR